MDRMDVVLIEAQRGETLDATSLREFTGLRLRAHFYSAEEALAEIALLAPRVIVLDVDAAEGDVIAAIRGLLLRSPQSALLCLSGDWDEEEENDYLGAGAKGCLVRPLNPADIVQALRRGEGESKADGEVIAFFSPKGKSGKTTLIANLAMALARKSGETVAVIDADVQFGDMAVFFNLEPETTIVEAVRDIRHLSPATLDTYFTAVNDRVRVLCGTRRPELSEYVRTPECKALIDMARAAYRYVLIDLPQGFNPISVMASEAADRVYLVTMRSGAYELRHLRRALEVFRSLDRFSERVRTVVTRVSECSESVRRELEAQIGYPVAGMLPNAYLLVSSAANNGRMALDIKPDSLLSRSIADLLADM